MDYNYKINDNSIHFQTGIIIHYTAVTEKLEKDKYAEIISLVVKEQSTQTVAQFDYTSGQWLACIHVHVATFSFS